MGTTRKKAWRRCYTETDIPFPENKLFDSPSNVVVDGKKKGKFVKKRNELKVGVWLGLMNIDMTEDIMLIMPLGTEGQGGGKRAQASDEARSIKHSKEDKMNGYSEEVATMTVLLGTPVYSRAETQLAITHINLVRSSLTENPKTVVSTMLTTLTSERLTAISENLGNNNFLHRTEMLSKAVFEYDYNQAKHRLTPLRR